MYSCCGPEFNDADWLPAHAINPYHESAALANVAWITIPTRSPIYQRITMEDAEETDRGAARRNGGVGSRRRERRVRP
jgi:hypothetical protein